MATRKRATEVLDPDAVIDVGAAHVIGLSRDRVLELAARWELEADELDDADPGEGTGDFILDFVAGMAGGVADGSRSDVLRACARELRSLAGRR